jgi:hypothetical protein
MSNNWGVCISHVHGDIYTHQHPWLRQHLPITPDVQLNCPTVLHMQCRHVDLPCNNSTCICVMSVASVRLFVFSNSCVTCVRVIVHTDACTYQFVDAMGCYVCACVRFAMVLCGKTEGR